MSETKSALIIANYRYEHPDLRQLVAPAQDAESLARVLGNPAIGGFQVRTLINELSHQVSLEIESFCDNRKRDDLLLLYFSGHGVKDADGQLYFATVDTQLVQHNVRRATAVSAHFVNEVMSRSRSRRQILLLDCCYSGAFKEGMLARGDKRVGAGEQLKGQGRVVLTASDALQYSFEGEGVQGEGIRSVFTSTLVHGLETGEADLDRDGLFSLDEVYDYLYARVSDEQPEQKPTKLDFVEGKIFIANNPRPLAAELPPELQTSLDDLRPWVRLGAVQELGKLLAGNNKGRLLAAHAALTSVARQDDSQQVRTAAEKCLAAYAEAQAARSKQAADELAADATKRAREEEARRERDRLEAERSVAEKAESVEKETVGRERAEREKAEAERLAHEKAEAERVAQEKAAQEQRERERVEAQRRAEEKAEQERLARDKAEAERLAREEAEAERVAQEKAAQEQRERERVEAQRRAEEKAEQERLARDKIEAERLAAQKLEAERRASEQAEAGRLAREKADRERRARGTAQEERLASDKAAQERLTREKTEAGIRVAKQPEAKPQARESPGADRRAVRATAVPAVSAVPQRKLQWVLAGVAAALIVVAVFAYMMTRTSIRTSQVQGRAPDQSVGGAAGPQPVASQPVRENQSGAQQETATLPPAPALRAAQPGGTEDILTDARTGLMWTRKDNGSAIPWDSAERYCTELTLGGYTGWRLPTTDELQGIYDANNVTGQYRLGPEELNLHTVNGFHLSNYVIWTGKAAGSDSAGFFRFNDGEHFRVRRENLRAMSGVGAAMCVRSSKQ